ncbi:dde tnp4 domain-containing protein [Citrus sinensis]|uniref:Dde tnp4 domain-containing protein n=1 Tax=Citrus sinensis TaxID=2711 RepID=A0ACB8KFW8_CITSI|nr:dde tnp4 domain-containing protein [Citrus sinensis]
MASNFKIKMLSDSSSDDDEIEMIAAVAIAKRRHKKFGRCGSIKGHATIWRDRLAGYDRLFHDYFSKTSTYPPDKFRRRFRMNRPLFLRIKNSVEQHDSYFVQKRNYAGVLGLSSLQKISAAMRMLAYGVSDDSIDEYVRIGESTAIESLKKFVPEGKQRGFPRMLGSLDCMNWKSKNCPVAWKGMYVGHAQEPTIILEAVASYDLWIWHMFFGLPGSHNDINVLDRSPLFKDLAEGRAPSINYSINGHNYTMWYYLADGIYPPWSTLVKTIPYPQENKHKNFAKAQESARKDVERAFGVLQARFVIVHGPAQFWDRDTLHDIMKACVIIHNMIVEDEHITKDIEDLNDDVSNEDWVKPSFERTIGIMEFIQNHHRIRSRENHSQLQKDLIEHLWKHQGSRKAM